MSMSPAPAEPIARTPPTGLTRSEVAQRRAAGLANEGGEHTSRPVSEILRANILTRFNFILGVLLAVILVTGWTASRSQWTCGRRRSSCSRSG
jgi:cation-transporting P-type ATPase E